MNGAPSSENYLYGKGSVLFKPAGYTGHLHLGNCPAFGLTVELEKAEHYSSMAGTKEKDLSKVTQKTVTAAITMEEFSAQNLNLVLMGGTLETATQEGTPLTGVEVTTVAGQFVSISEGTLRLSDIVVTDAASDPTTTYVEGTDYIVNEEAGLIMALSDGNISGICFVSATVADLTTSTVKALTESSVSGELWFVGNPDVGPNWQVKGWQVELSLSGELSFISDDLAQITVDAEFTADHTSHADAPFFEAVNVA